MNSLFLNDKNQYHLYETTKINGFLYFNSDCNLLKYTG